MGGKFPKKNPDATAFKLDMSATDVRDNSFSTN